MNHGLADQIEALLNRNGTMKSVEIFDKIKPPNGWTQFKLENNVGSVLSYYVGKRWCRLSRGVYAPLDKAAPKREAEPETPPAVAALQAKVREYAEENIELSKGVADLCSDVAERDATIQRMWDDNAALQKRVDSLAKSQDEFRELAHHTLRQCGVRVETGETRDFGNGLYETDYVYTMPAPRKPWWRRVFG